MKAIKLWDGVKVITSQNVTKHTYIRELFEFLNMDGDAYREARDAVMTQLFCFRRFDMTEAYGGHTVILECYTDEEEQE